MLEGLSSSAPLEMAKRSPTAVTNERKGESTSNVHGCESSLSVNQSSMPSISLASTYVGPSLPLVERMTFTLRDILVDKLRRNDIPDGTLLGHITHSVITLNGLSLRSLDAESVYLRNLLGAVECQRRTRRFLPVLRASLAAPIRRLPVECLARVFDLACGFNTFALRTKDFNLPAMVVSQVCTWWRSLSMGAAQSIWAKIHVQFSSNTSRSDSVTEALLRTYLSRSGNKSLQIVLSCIHPFQDATGLNDAILYSYINSSHFESQRHLLDVVISQCSRWSEISVNPMLAPMFRDFRGSLSRLSAFVIEDQFTLVEDAKKLWMEDLCSYLFAEQPRSLERVNIPGWALTCCKAPIKSLNKVEVSALTFDRVSDLFDYCPSLKTLSLSISPRGLLPSPWNADSTYTFDFMESLEVIFPSKMKSPDGSDVMSGFLSRVNAPALKVVHISTLSPIILKGNSLSVFLSSSKFLTNVALGDFRICDEDFRRCLSGLPQVWSLALSDKLDYFGEDGSYSLLAISKIQMLSLDNLKEHSIPVLPSLTRLILCGKVFTVDRSFIHIIESRKNQTRCQSLNQLMLSFETLFIPNEKDHALLERITKLKRDGLHITPELDV